MTNSGWLNKLPTSLRGLYTRLDRGRKRIVVDKQHLVVYAGSVNGAEEGILELIERGLVYRICIGLRKVLVLGTWEVVERRLVGEGVVSSEIFTEEMIDCLKRYPDRVQRVIEEAFRAFASVRRSGSVSPRILLRELEYYVKFPVDVVEEGLQIYVDGDFVVRGIKENYARGIIRGCARSLKETDHVSEAETPVRYEEKKPDPRSTKVKEQRKQAAALQEQIDDVVDELTQERFGCPVDALAPSQLKDLLDEAKRRVISGS